MRKLPVSTRYMVDEYDLILNRNMPAQALIEGFKSGILEPRIDAGQALKAAASGVQVGVLPSILALMPIPLAIAAIVSPFIWSAWGVPLFVLLAILSFKASKALTWRRVLTKSLENPMLLDRLMELGIVWFRSAGNLQQEAERR